MCHIIQEDETTVLLERDNGTCIGPMRGVNPRIETDQRGRSYLVFDLIVGVNDVPNFVTTGEVSRWLI